MELEVNKCKQLFFDKNPCNSGNSKFTQKSKFRLQKKKTDLPSGKRTLGIQTSHQTSDDEQGVDRSSPKRNAFGI